MSAVTSVKKSINRRVSVEIPSNLQRFDAFIYVPNRLFETINRTYLRKDSLNAYLAKRYLNHRSSIRFICESFVIY
jgi:hypothetical protein